MAFTGANMFSILDDEDGPKPVVARVPVPAPAAKPVAKPVARQADKPGGNAGGAKGKPRAPRAPREFEGEVVGTEGAKARPRNSDRQRKPKEGEAGPGRRNDRADRSGRGNEGADAAVDLDAPAPEPEPVVNEVSIDDYEKAKAEKKAALAVLMKKGDAVAKVVDDSAFAGLKIGEGKADANEFSVEAGFHVKAKKEAKKETKTKQVLATGFKTAPIATDRDDRDDRDDRGGSRGGRGGRWFRYLVNAVA
jgi:plasminogen activator inhibitor 1 RNA-binding protein